MAKSPADIIDEKGGPAAVAAKVGKKAGAVRQWKLRDQFPRAAWPEITAAFPELTQDALKEIEGAQ